MALAITRTDLSAEDLRGQARRAQDGDQACRLVALALVLEGACRMAAARAGGMDRQTLRDWVIRYNEAGVDGLRDRPRSGRRPRLNAEQLAELARLVEEGPDVAVHGAASIFKPRSRRASLSSSRSGTSADCSGSSSSRACRCGRAIHKLTRRRSRRLKKLRRPGEGGIARCRRWKAGRDGSRTRRESARRAP